MQKFRKKPVVIESMLFTGDNETEIAAWMGLACDGAFTHPDGFAIRTLEGTIIASPGDWIIRGVKGEFCRCKPDIFAATYERIA
jgi:hypothetical protein